MRARARCVTLCHALVFGAVAAALLTRPVSAEDLPRTPDELWQRIPSYDVHPGKRADYQTKFCRTMLDDLKHRPEKFHRVPPAFTTDDFDDPGLKKRLPDCSRKHLTFLQPPGYEGPILESWYRDEAFAVWPLDMIDPDYPDDIMLVWMGAEYHFDNDRDEYLAPKERTKFKKEYGGYYGSIAGVRKKSCEILEQYSLWTLEQYDGKAPKMRNMFIVEYGGSRFLWDVAPDAEGEEYITSQRLDPISGNTRQTSDTKSCVYFSE